MFSISLFNPFSLGTFIIAIIAWIITFAGSIAAATSAVYPKFSWWALVYELIIIVVVIVFYLFHLHKVYKTFLCCLLSIAFVYTSNSTNNLVYLSSASCGAASAGFIILSMVNLCWLFYFGSDSSSPIIQYINSFENNSNGNSGHNNNTVNNNGRTMNNLNNRNSTGTYYSSNDSPMINTTNEDSYHDKQYASQKDLNQINTPQSNSNPFEPIEQTQFSQLKGFENATTATNTSSINNRLSYLPSGSNTNNNSNHNLVATTPETQQDEDYPILVRGLYDYQASPDDINELSFKKGELLRVKDSNGNWWQGKNSNGDIGMCPSNYLEIVN